MKNALSIILVFTLVQACSTQTFQQNLGQKLPAINFNEKVDSIVIAKMNEYNVPGLAIGLVSNDSIIYTRGYGVRNIDLPDLVTENTIFHTASVSKLFTAQAIMLLVQQEKLALNDKLVDLLPNLNYNDQGVAQITVKNILNHTSGLPDVSNYNWGNYKRADHSLKDYVMGLDLSLDSEPGTEYQYSNLAYDVLGHVVEKVSGLTFDDYLKENVLLKNGMGDSDFRHFKIADALKTAPHGKGWVSGAPYVRDTYPYTREHAPSSTLNASAKELVNWMISFLANLEDLAVVNNHKAMLEPTFEDYPHIGLGFQLGHIGTKKSVGHYGGDKGFRSYLVMVPEEKMGLVLLANCDYNEDFRQEILHPIAEVMFP